MPVRISKNRVALENIPLNEALGTSIASAGTINLTTATGNTVHVTGTTSITTVTLGAGMIRDVIFDGSLTLTHHATNNNLPGGQNITTAVNDRARYIGDGTTVYCVSYQRADGTPIASGVATSLGLFTRDTSLASGTQVVAHGLGKIPKLVTLTAAAGSVTVLYPFSVGHDNGVGARNCHYIDWQNGHYANSIRSVHAEFSSSSVYEGYISAIDGTNMTIAWTRVGTPTASLQVTFSVIG